MCIRDRLGNDAHGLCRNSGRGALPLTDSIRCNEADVRVRASASLFVSGGGVAPCSSLSECPGLGTCPAGVGSPVPWGGGLFGFVPREGELPGRSCLGGVRGGGSSVWQDPRVGLASRCPVSQQPPGRLSCRIQKSRFWMEPGFFRVSRRSGFFCFRFSFFSPPLSWAAYSRALMALVASS
mgnify:CR=1 FL=1